MNLRYLGTKLLTVCTKLYNFILQCLTSCARKTVTLGLSKHKPQMKPVDPQAAGLSCISNTPRNNQDGVKELPKSPNKEGVDNNNNVEEKCDTQLKAPTTSRAPPKKAVSINETVEEFKVRPKIRRRKSTDKSRLLVDEEPDKPLKSILREGSKLDEKSDPFADDTNVM